uniref:Uncharacterized protein n=1 Tax=Acrobeloides nanus TaxID=290746 RepID=A0A914BX00_9BILA
MLLWILFYFLIFDSVRLNIDALDFLDNELAKICHPIDNSLDLLFILDGSGGSRSTFDSQLTALTKVVEMVEIGHNSTQIAVMQYGTYTYMEFLFNVFSNIRHKSGTTRTGKALDKAFDVLHDEKSGVRKGRVDVAPIVIIVSDGHSRDDPVAAANRLRQSGVRVLALGIGPHINVEELVAIAGTPEFVFQNLTDENSFQRFMETFEKFTMGEQCEFARGKNGSDIRCNSDSISISVSTSKPFHGHLFVDGRFNDKRCVARSNNSDITLKVGLTECGLKRQFSVNPKGFIFETKVLLQFHPDYVTAVDKVFDVRCFYSDTQQRDDETEIDWQLVQSVRNRRKNQKDEAMPCKYSLSKKDMGGCKTPNNFTTIDDRLFHKWECNADNYDTYQSFLVHSCFVVDASRNVGRMIIDEKGCSLEPEIISTPIYDDSLSAHSEGMVIHHPDTPLLKMKCSLKFCDRLMSECDDILPPRCGGEIQVKKRQAGFPVSIRPLNGKSSETERDVLKKKTTPKLITFKRRKSNNQKGLKKKKQRSRAVQNVSVTISKENNVDIQLAATKSKERHEQIIPKVPLSKAVPISGQAKEILDPILNVSIPNPKVSVPRSIGTAEVKLNTQDVRVISASSEEKDNSSEDRFILKPVREPLKGIEDPFQENEATNKTTEKGINIVSKEIDANVNKQLSMTEFQIESDTIMISNSNASCMKRIKN